jgi:acetolactate synthase I/II/III large subunit
MKGSDLLVAALENEGVDRIFGIPGEENLDVVEALRRSRIKLVVTRHEQAAAFMAATHGRLTGKPGVCLTTLGPGALNLTTGAAYALLGAMPMVMITGQKGILSRKQARFQVVDIVSAMAPLTKMAHQIVSSATIPSIVREAFRLHSRKGRARCTWNYRRTSLERRRSRFGWCSRIRSTFRLQIPRRSTARPN